MFQKAKYILSTIGITLMFSSCITYEKVNYMQEPGQYSVPHYVDTLDFEEYKIRIDDRLYVRVYSTDEKFQALFNGGMQATNMNQLMNGDQGNSSTLYTYLVHEDGTINFPEIGKVKVHGLTTRETKKLLEEELTSFIAQHEGYKNISVDVNIVNRFFSVIGSLQSGRYAIPKEKMTIFEALAAAGDISDLGDKHQIKIIRQIEGKTKVKTFDIRSKDIVNSEFYYIEPNDVIYIRNRRGYSFGLSSFPAVLGVASTTLSFGVFLYVFINNYIVTPLSNSGE